MYAVWLNWLEKSPPVSKNSTLDLRNYAVVTAAYRGPALPSP